MKIGKDRILRDLLDFFFDELKRDRAGTEDWVAQGEIDAGDFIAEARQLRREIELRDNDTALPRADGGAK